MEVNFSMALRDVRPGARTCRPAERDMQAVGEESDEDVRLGPRLVPVKDRPDGEVALKVAGRPPRC
jgi:hypothetical protein